MPQFTRQLTTISPGLVTADGADVKLTRFIGQPNLVDLDPFLLFDAFGTDEPRDYIGGFPPHPHRGFETVTYLLAGKMRHEDNAGHQGLLEPGGIQWMTAGRGIIHSEMPELEQGLLLGFQLWVNLPSHLKMTAPAYQEYSPDKIAVETQPNGAKIRVIAGQTDQGTQGIIHNETIQPTYLDVTLKENGCFCQTLPPNHQAFIYLHEGNLLVGDIGQSQRLQTKQLGILGFGHKVCLQSTQQTARFLLIAGQPLHQPIARRGPFVMNTEAEIRQAFEDYRLNRF